VTKVGRWALAVFFVVAGLNHFRDPAFYLSMMPPVLPFPGVLNVLAGVFEILGGIGVLVPRTQRFAGWGLIALLIAVFPANIYAALNGSIAGLDAPSWTLWARLPFQALFLAWVWAVTLRKEKSA
jgi:uncharacterized membrane protein